MNAFTGSGCIKHNRILWSCNHRQWDNRFILAAQSSVGGNLILTSGHASGITDSGTVTVGGNLLATTTDANSGVINLDTCGGSSYGTVVLTTNGSGNATVVNDAGLNFAASTCWR